MATPSNSNGVIKFYAEALAATTYTFHLDVNKTLVIVCSIILWFFIIAVPTALLIMKCMKEWKRNANERVEQRNQERVAVFDNNNFN